MENRVPLTTNKVLKRIEELPVGSNLDLTNSGIVSAVSIQSETFFGNLVGIASTALTLPDAANILSGTVDRARLDGLYDINISGTADFLTSAENILSGTISPDRLDGYYNIDVDYAKKSGISTNVIGGIASVTSLSVSGISTLRFLTATDAVYTGVVTATTFYGNLVGTASTALQISTRSATSPGIYYPTFVDSNNVTLTDEYLYTDAGISYDPSTDLLKAGKLNITGISTFEGDMKAGVINADTYYGDGINIVGIVTQIVPGIGVDIFGTQDPRGLGKGVVKIDAYRPIGKTIYVSQNGNDENTGLTENHTKRTIKAAAAIALFGDTIQVFPGVYVEENPIILAKTVSVNGTELRNCVVTPKYPDQDLFYVNNGCHVNNLSFIGQNSTNGAAVVALQPLKGTAADRFFDASRLIRLNLDYISREAVGFLTSGFSGYAGNHREQDAARLIDLNINYIAAETVGFLTSTAYLNPPFTVVNAAGISTDIVNCVDDIKDILRSISYDLKANSNKKSVGAGLTYYNNTGALQYITGVDPNGYSVKNATIAAINRAVGIATYVINNYAYPTAYTTLTQDFSYSPVVVSGGCTETVNKINTLASYVTDILDTGPSAAPAIQYGVRLEPELCAKDVKNIWKGICFDITRGGNSKCVGAGLSYYDKDGNLIPQILANPGEVSQTIATLDYSFNVARSVVNNCTWGGYPVGLGTTVVTAVYGKETGITTITATNHGLSKDDAVKIQGLEFTCPGGSGITTTIFPNGKFGYVFPVKTVIDADTFEFVGGISTITHDYLRNGTIQKYSNFQNEFTQVKDLGIQTDIETGFNDSINSCQNVISALRSCVGVVTTIVGLGTTSGINTTYPGNSGIGFTTVAEITTATYDEKSGKTSITAPGLSIKVGDIVEVRNLTFSCSSGGAPSIQIFPSGKNGYEFYVDKVYQDGSFNINVGVSTLAHNYEYGGFVVNRSVDVDDAIYDNITGITTITAPGSYIRTGDLVELRNLVFSCSSGGAPSTQIFPSGKSGGFVFKVLDIVTDRPVGITSALYNNVTGITTITAPNFTIEPGGYVELRDLLFSCSSGGAPSTQIFPSGKSGGFKFKVLDTVGLGNTFTVNVGVSTLAHDYVSGGIAINKTSLTNNQFTVQVGVSTLAHTYVPDTGVILPPYSKGVGPITQGPYIRNCTNFIPDSIGMKVDGFEAEPGDADDIGVTGTMSVDSYTQYNQGGIGVSITNGGYAQLVSIFTICDDIAIYTGSGGQCDLTNSNSSFGNYGLYSNGVGDAGTKSLYRYTGKTVGTSVIEDDVVLVSGLGNYRPYDGQAIYFDTLYYTVQTIVVDNQGSGYSDNNPPRVDIDFPQGPSGIRAEASPNVIDGKLVSIDVIASGNQYLTPPKITIAPPPGPGTQATAHSTIYPIYYNLESASLPVNGTSRIVLTSRLNNTIPEGSTVYFSRLSLQIATTISFEWVGAGTNINTAKPALGGITLPNNEVVKLNGGQVVFTSTNQAGNFRIGEGVTVNQLTGTITGRSFSQSLLNTVTPLIIALSK
jgi:hypothetical protein